MLIFFYTKHDQLYYLQCRHAISKLSSSSNLIIWKLHLIVLSKHSYKKEKIIVKSIEY